MSSLSTFNEVLNIVSSVKCQCKRLHTWDLRFSESDVAWDSSSGARCCINWRVFHVLRNVLLLPSGSSGPAFFHCLTLHYNALKTSRTNHPKTQHCILVDLTVQITCSFTILNTVKIHITSYSVMPEELISTCYTVPTILDTRQNCRYRHICFKMAMAGRLHPNLLYSWLNNKKLIFLLHDRLSPVELLTQFIADMNNYTTAVWAYKVPRIKGFIVRNTPGVWQLGLQASSVSISNFFQFLGSFFSSCNVYPPQGILLFSQKSFQQTQYIHQGRK